MATFTITDSKKWDAAAFSTRAGGDTYNINGGTLMIDTDTRYCANSTNLKGTIGIVTIGVAQGGNLIIDARDVWHIPYDTGTGNVPAGGTVISRGSVQGYLINVTANITTAPTAAGSAMPASGIIKIKTLTGGNFASGALSGIEANATGAEVRGFLEVVGEASSYTTLNSGNFQALGAFFQAGITDGTAGQIIQCPTYGGTNSQYWGCWIETAQNSGVYDRYPGIPTAQFTGYATDARNKVVNSLTNGQLRIGKNATVNNAYTPPANCRVLIPNISLNVATSAAKNAKSASQLIATLD